MGTHPVDLQMSSFPCSPASDCGSVHRHHHPSSAVEAYPDTRSRGRVGMLWLGLLPAWVKTWAGIRLRIRPVQLQDGPYFYSDTMRNCAGTVLPVLGNVIHRSFYITPPR
ncbi:hypothetical protein KC19_2G055800 [Ceratodon purpureus]|uniref:Uncharacterized protein n=1 Tax=Ceratodon purpureus TaxID=3225 RepID=A0A8T0IQI0_CERPU|nr:hypothetical protein KC19_2G055800 [Ceratodon purpureus]